MRNGLPALIALVSMYLTASICCGQDVVVVKVPATVQGNWKVYGTRTDGVVTEEDGYTLFAVTASTVNGGRGEVGVKSVKIKTGPFGDVDHVITLTTGPVLWLTSPSKDGLRQLVIWPDPNKGSLKTMGGVPLSLNSGEGQPLLQRPNMVR